MLATFKKLSFFLFKSAVCQVKLRLFIMCRIAMAVSRAHSFKQFSLIFSITQLVYLVTMYSQRSYWLSVISQYFGKISSNSTEISKFCKKAQIPRLGSKFHDLQKTVGLNDNKSKCKKMFIFSDYTNSDHSKCLHYRL